MAAVLNFQRATTSGAPRGIGAAVAVGLHALAAFALLSYEPARSALFAAAPLMVDLVAPPKVELKPEPPVEVPPPAKPKPVVKPKPAMKPRPKASEPLPLIAAPVEAPSPIAVPVPPPEPPAPAPEPAPVVAAPEPAPVVPVTPPLFNADYLDNPPPAYPALSRRLGEEGRVILRVLVSTAGSADEVEIRSSSGYSRLDEAARDTVRGWKFGPAKRGEQAVAAWVLVPISFRLEG